MSVRKMADVWEHSSHSGSKLLMLLAIADFADDDGRAYPSVATLAAKCRMKLRNANVILAALRESGELQVRFGSGPRGANSYRIVPMQRNASQQWNAPLHGSTAPPARECSKPLQGNASNTSVNHQGTISTRSRRTPKASIPEDFGISERVASWAAMKGFGLLDEHLESFKAKCAANGYAYADWDAAFQEAVRQDWAGLRKSMGKGAMRPASDNFAERDYGQGGKL